MIWTIEDHDHDLRRVERRESETLVTVIRECRSAECEYRRIDTVRQTQEVLIS